MKFSNVLLQMSWIITYVRESPHTVYIEVFMQGKCGRDTETTFKLKRMFGTHGNWKNQNPGGRFGATS